MFKLLTQYRGKVASLLVLCLLALPLPAFAETFTTPTVTIPPPPPPPPPPDRKDGSGKAAAMAAAAAAIAGMSCAMLMAEAAKTQDPAMKKMLMSQAMQQCAQAAQNAMAAGKNNDSKNATGGAPVPAMAQLQAAPSLQTPPPTTPFQLPPETPGEEPAAPPELPDVELTPPQKAEAAPEEAVAVVDSRTALDPIERPNLGFNESSKAGGSTPSAGGSSGVSLGMGSMSAADLKKLSLNEAAHGVAANGANRLNRGDTSDLGDGSGGGSGGGGSGNGGGSDGAFDSMLSQIFGGGAPQAEAVGGGGSDIVSLNDGKGKSANGKDRAPNIFEYASYRYKNATFQEGRIKSRVIQRTITHSKETAFLTQH